MFYRRLFSAGVAVIALGGYVSLGLKPLPDPDAAASAKAPGARLTLAAAVTGGPIVPPTTIAAPPPPPPPPPTTVAPRRAAVPRPPRASRSAAPRAQVANVGGDVWGALARCESGGRANAVSRSGKYFGAFQFSLQTWRAMGMSGSPIDHPYETQLAAAQRLQARSGWGQWPHCSRRLGLR